MPSAYRPKHEHDCDRCILLGAHIFEGVWHDLYFCNQGGRRPTLIARYGPEGNYISGMQCVGYEPPITVAHSMATKRGLIHATDTA